MNIKNIIIIIIALLILLVDFFGSCYLILGKKPFELFGMTTTTITEKKDLVITKTTPQAVEQKIRKEENDIVFTNIFEPKEVSAGEKVDFDCTYVNYLNRDIEVNAEVVLVSQGTLNERIEGDSYSFFLQSVKIMLKKTKGQLLVEYNIPVNLPDGYYRSMLNIYSNDHKDFHGRCGTGLFLIKNTQSVPLVFNQSEKNRTKIITSGDNKVIYSIVSNKDLNNVQPKLIIFDPVSKTAKIYFEKKQEKINLIKDQTREYVFDISGFGKTGIFLMNIILSDSDGKKINTSPLFPLVIGEMPQVMTVDAVNISGTKYRLNLTFASEEKKPSPQLSMNISVCDQQNCDYVKKNFKDGWVKEIVIDDSQVNINKPKITITLSVLGMNGTLNKFIKN